LKKSFLPISLFALVARHPPLYLPTTYQSINQSILQSYFYTLLFPSAALMPMEYCFPLMDVADVVTDLDFVVSYRQFVLERTGVGLIIVT
jgi:hypothetical protein